MHPRLTSGAKLGASQVSRKLRLGNYHNFSLFVLLFELGLKLVLINIWLWSSIEEF